VRMRHDGEGSNRNNWLLIKHRDGHEREGDAPVTDQDRSVDRDAQIPADQSIAFEFFTSDGLVACDQCRAQRICSLSPCPTIRLKVVCYLEPSDSSLGRCPIDAIDLQ
jgi:hypothetical protein